MYYTPLHVYVVQVTTFPCTLSQQACVKKHIMLELDAEQPTAPVQSTPLQETQQDKPPAPAPTFQYAVTFKTGSSFGASTAATVSIELMGSTGTWWKPETLGESQEFPKNPFESKQTDTFLVTSPKELGPLQKVRVSHDGTGALADWQLEGMQVRNVATGAMYVFPCQHAWLKKGKPLAVHVAIPPAVTQLEKKPEEAAKKQPDLPSSPAAVGKESPKPPSSPAASLKPAPKPASTTGSPKPAASPAASIQNSPGPPSKPPSASVKVPNPPPSAAPVASTPPGAGPPSVASTPRSTAKPAAAKQVAPNKVTPAAKPAPAKAAATAKR